MAKVKVKVYACPECQGQFTTTQIKKNGRKCMTCETPLKHEMGRTTGKLVHRWIVDHERQSPISEVKPTEAAFERLLPLPDTPDNAPDIYKRINPPAKEGDSTYRVVYKNRYGTTALRCPECGMFLHTTNLIAGSRQGTLCRSSKQTGPTSGKKCKTRTEYVFLRNGETYDAYSS